MNGNSGPAINELGMYLLENGEVFKVQRSRQSGRLYAKNLRPVSGQRLTDDGHRVAWEFIYAPGAIWALKAEHRMTLEQAQAFGIRHGVCCICGATLKDAKSVTAGIGPVCAKSQGWKVRAA